MFSRGHDPAAMTLSDLIDLEAQLARDREADLAVLETRDRALLAGAPGASRRTLLERWLQGLRETEPGQLHPGRAVVGVLRGIAPRWWSPAWSWGGPRRPPSCATPGTGR